MSMARLFLIYSAVLLIVGSILLVIFDNGTMNTDDIRCGESCDDNDSDYFDNTIIRKVLKRHFDGLSGGSVFPLMASAGAASNVCMTINYNDTYENIREKICIKLRLDDFCGPHGAYKDDMTCKALDAAEASMNELTSLAISENKGPMFYNAAALDYLSKDGSVTTCKQGSMSQVILSNATVAEDYVNPSATLQTKNGCNLYALCDIVASVLTDTSDQGQTGTCGPTAIYTWLMMRDPTRALKYAIELFWTSGVNEKDSVVNTCPVYLAAQPGLIPFASGTYGFPSALHKRSFGNPLNQPGLQHMATTALVSEYYRYLKNEIPDKDICPKMSDPVLLNVVMDDATVTDVEHRTGYVSSNAILHWCKAIVFNDKEGDCEMLCNPETASKLFPDSKDALKYYTKISMIATKYAPDEMLAAIPNMQANPNLSFSKTLRYRSNLEGIKIDGAALQIDDLLTMVPNVFANPQSPEYKRFDKFMASTSITNEPNFDKANVCTICARGGGILRIAGSALPSSRVPKETPLTLATIGTFTHNCDHFILLTQCDPDADEYLLWTWGLSIWVRKEVLLAIVCDAVVGPKH